MDTNVWVMLLGIILVASFGFNFIQSKYQVSSVILLIISGSFIKLMVKYFAIDVNLPTEALSIFGTLGLLVIVLEAVMDMEITKANHKTFWFALAISSMILILTSLALACGIMLIYHTTLYIAIIYAIPLSIVSSAIVIPSLINVSSNVKELLILESVFADIIGVLLFNFFTTSDTSMHMANLGLFGANMMLMIIISAIITLLLGAVISHDKLKNSHVFILATLILIYSLAEAFHLSALVLVLIFGLLLRNIQPILSSKLGVSFLHRHLSKDQIQINLGSMKEFIDDLGFIIRSIFFVLLGFSINFSQIVNMSTIGLGIGTLVIIYLVRWIILRWFLSHYKQLLTIIMAPRGLITVLLFFQIPSKFIINKFDNGILFFVVIITAIIMTGGLIKLKNKDF